MVIDIKMCRFDSVPWGFRLVGGSDFEVPLTVVKVTEGSIAEEAGLRVDDIIVRINDDPTSPMTHDEAHKVISHCGNVFYLGIHREDAEKEVEKFFPVNDTIQQQLSPSPIPFLNSSNQSEVGEVSSPTPPTLVETDGILAETEPETKAEDEEIASLLKTEAEVLKEHDVVGIFPKPGVCQSSEVLRQLNEESIKTRQEIEIEKKKWTTFMQKPNRPIPKSKQQLEAEARAANAYKVKIVKNYKKPEPVRPPSPIPEPEPEPEEEPPKIVTPPPEIEEEPPTDSEVPNLEQTEPTTSPEDQPLSQTEPEGGETNVENVDSIKEGSVSKEERSEASVDREEKAPFESDSVREKTEEELQLELQLAEVQKQLLALANLPSAIQSTLDAVTKQLSELLPTFKLPTNITKEATPEVKEEEKKQEEEETEVSKDIIVESVVTEADVVEKEDEVHEVIETEVAETKCVKIETEVKQEYEEKVQIVEVSTRNIEEEQMEEEQNLKRKKENGVIEELQKQIEQKEVQKRKRSKRMFGPLVPQERPLILPGGRRWYRPKDAYNDEFIAETLTAQAELIAGTAVGENNCASVVGHLGMRVNFMKYQKPEKKIDLDKSEVYKVIHHLDRSPVRGIEVRPPVVVAEADVLKVVES